jgi:hypothetical protein
MQRAATSERNEMAISSKTLEDVLANRSASEENQHSFQPARFFAQRRAMRVLSGSLQSGERMQADDLQLYGRRPAVQ